MQVMSSSDKTLVESLIGRPYVMAAALIKARRHMVTLLRKLWHEERLAPPDLTAFVADRCSELVMQVPDAERAACLEVENGVHSAVPWVTFDLETDYRPGGVRNGRKDEDGDRITLITTTVMSHVPDRDVLRGGFPRARSLNAFFTLPDTAAKGARGWRALCAETEARSNLAIQELLKPAPLGLPFIHELKINVHWCESESETIMRFQPTWSPWNRDSWCTSTVTGLICPCWLAAVAC
jgi:hypothetical protein